MQTCLFSKYKFSLPSYKIFSLAKLEVNTQSFAFSDVTGINSLFFYHTINIAFSVDCK